MPSTPIRILIVAALCVLSLIGLVVHEGAARAAGREIMMEMQAVDPRSLLSGHYVTIGLQTQIGDGGNCQSFTRTDAATWLALSYNGPEFRVPPPEGTPMPYAPRAQTASRDEAQHLGEIAVRGVASCDQVLDAEGKPQQLATVRTTLDGISRFYIDQKQAERIDRLLRQREDARVLAILSIGTDGRARLKGLWVDGQRLELNWL